MRMRNGRVALALFACLVVTVAGHAAGQGAQTASPGSAPAFAPEWRLLIGDWSGDGSGQPGSATGRTSYEFEAGEHAIVRRNRADVAASGGRPASVHEDLLVIYPAGKPGEARALYVDNEDHVIQYHAAWSADGKTLVFVSDASAAAPRFRMTYRIHSADEHVLDFDIAPPGSPDGFKPYVSGRLRRIPAGR